MPDLERISMTIDKRLLDRFDLFCRRNQLGNRSEAIRDLIRARLIDDESESGSGEAVATVTLVYDHHQRKLADRLTDEGHAHVHEVVATMHVHLDHDYCLEVIALRGSRKKLKALAEQLIGLKGVQHGELVLSRVA